MPAAACSTPCLPMAAGAAASILASSEAASIGGVPYSAVDNPLTAAQEAAVELGRRTGVDRFDVAVVLGSGWKDAVAQFGEPAADVAATELPGFLAAGVEGHEGRVQAFDRD